MVQDTLWLRDKAEVQIKLQITCIFHLFVVSFDISKVNHHLFLHEANTLDVDAALKLHELNIECRVFC